MGAVSINEEKVIALVIVGEEGKLSILVPLPTLHVSLLIRSDFLFFVFQFLSASISRQVQASIRTEGKVRGNNRQQVAKRRTLRVSARTISMPEEESYNSRRADFAGS